MNPQRHKKSHFFQSSNSYARVIGKKRRFIVDVQKNLKVIVQSNADV